MTEKIKETIIEETELEEDELEEELEDKMDEFSGLVSEEGALHLVAKEYGVDLSEETEEELKVENVVPDMRNVNLKARVTNILEERTFDRDDGDEGKVRNIVLGDDTGTIRLTLWDDQTKIAEKVEEGDPIEIQSAYTVEDDRENAELRLGDSSQVKMADEDEVSEVETGGSGEISEVSVREVRSENTGYRVKGMIVNIYTSNPFYSTCPECGTSVRETEDGDYECEDHGEVEPDKALAVSAVIDDGTDNIRAVFFRDQARELLDLEEEVEEEADIERVEEAAEDAVGKELEIEGRTRFNDYFGRLEIIVDEMEPVEPGDEIEKLMEVMEA